MPTVKLTDVRRVRAALGLTQGRAATLLGVSIKAVQSYEQGFRSVPAHVQRTAALLLYARWRKQGGQSCPCWKINGCNRENQPKCPVFEYQAGDLCWMLTGTLCQGVKKESATVKLARCQKCAVMSRWLEY